jgi:hypothetical protein
MRIVLLLLTLLPGAALAEAAASTAPQAMTAEAEIWYAAACAGLVLSLIAAQWLVSRR